MKCDEFERLLEAYLDETLADDLRGDVRRHLASCGGCSERALQREPTLLLTMARRREPRPERIEHCVASVMGQVRQRRLERELEPGSGRRWLAAAAVAIMVVGAGLLWRISGMPDNVAAPQLQPAVVEASDGGGEPGPPPRIEIDMPGEGVRVYQFADDQSDDSAVYFVVNPALES